MSNTLLRISTTLGVVVALAAHAAKEPELVSFATPDSGLVHGLLSGEGERGVVLAHGGSYNKEGWAQQARILADNGFRVLAFDFRGYGESHGPGEADVFTAPLYHDVIAAVRYLHALGAKRVSVVGGSLGGSAAARATMRCAPGEIERVVLLGARPGETPEKMTGRKLFIATHGDTTGDGTLRIIRIREEYEKVPDPKQMILLDGAAHAQGLFKTDQGDRVMRDILQFLNAP